MRISDWSSDVCSSDLLQVERDRAAIVQRHGHACRRDVLNRTERSVLYPQAALVAQEHDPVAGCEGALAPFGTDGNIFTKFAAGAQALARGLVQCPRSEEHTSELQSLMRISYAVFCLKKKKN